MKETDTKTQSKGVRVLKAFLNTVINILIVVILITSILIAIMSLTSKSSGISTIFGYTVQPIQSDSMKGGSEDFDGGDFEKGDLMIAKATGFDASAVYHIGDIVTFKEKDIEGNTVLVSHRIIDAVETSGGMRYQTWGDNREVSKVPDQMEESEYIDAIKIGSVFYSQEDESQRGFLIKGLGTVIDFLKTQFGFFLVVLLPMIIFFMYAMIRVVLSATGYKKAKQDEDKDKAVKEAVAAALAEKEGISAQASDSTAVNAGAPAGMSAEELEQFRQFQAFQKMQNAAKEAQTDPAETTDTEE